ncbi:phage antirepressor N-terminal domain-containing protein [Vandammella animalimorsus]|nr:phage antirepressor N-terminal domain-containing protein [Vandammella animalimorsus]
MANALTTVDFHGQALLVTLIDGQPAVALRPVCDAIGLDWQAQLQRIKRNPVLAEGVCITTTPSQGGPQQTTCLPLNMLNGWLFGISASRVKPELRERLIQYQRECFDVLARHFGAAPAQPYSVSPDQTLSAEQAQTLRSLLQDFAKSMPKDLQAQIMVQGWSKLKAHFKVDYRHIPANQFTEAVSILSRHIAQWAPADPQKTTAPALDLTGGPAMQAAHEAACQYIDNLRSGQQQRWDLPPEVLQGLVLDALMSQRFIVSFGYGHGMSINPIARDAYVLPSSKWASAIESGDAHLPPEELARLANVCTQRMARALQRRLPPAQPPALA